jgi:hypothetical protein
MELRDCLILIGLGGLFIILGVVGIGWGRKEERVYFEALAKRRGDVREFMEHWPPRHQPGALKLGGWIAIALGVALLVTGGIFCLLI